MSEPSDGGHDDSRDNPNGWRVISDVLTTITASAGVRHLEEQERTTNAELGGFVRMLPAAIEKLTRTKDARELVAIFSHILQEYLNSRTFNAAAAKQAEEPLKKSIADLRGLPEWLRDKVQEQGNGQTLNVSWHRMSITPLSQRVAPADMLTALEHVQNVAVTTTIQAVQALEQALELQHVVRQVTHSDLHIAPPTLTDGPILIVLPKRSDTSPDGQVRYMQERLLDLAAKVETWAKSYAKEAEKSHDGSDPSAVVNTAKDVLVYAARLIWTCNELNKVITGVSPHPAER